jgi:glycyl-tRNA synthetase beta chain
MTSAKLLVEVRTEELPPRSLRALSEAFLQNVHGALVKAQLAKRDAGERAYATPRRIALTIDAVASAAPDREIEVTGPAAKAPAQALAGFARKNGVPVESLERREGPKGEVMVARVQLKGAVLQDLVAGLVAEALGALPIQKLMRWGAGEAQFVRPVHGITLLHGRQLLPGKVLGLESSRRTTGHRFMGAASIELASADEYPEKLRREGMVIADFAERRADIEAQLQALAAQHQAALGHYGDLLDEVTALVEHPSVYVGSFDASFLQVPQECLILTMRQNQKYFPLFDAKGKLLARFLVVSNMKLADARNIVRGNERVVRPRLEDARFFYEQDQKQRLESRVPLLAKVVYHNKLGSQLERVERIQLLAGHIARQSGAEVALAERAAWLSKADLLTGMVGEFPELQGIIGRYYALHDGEPDAVADTIDAHYRPRFAGDKLPEGGVACAVALADKLDVLAGLFGIGEQPTGEKDPFGLRRAALGLIRILVERKLALPLNELVEAAVAGYKDRNIVDAQAELIEFVLGRFAGYLREQGFSTLQVDAVLSQRPMRLELVPLQLEAVRAFEALPEAESLASANKRVANILRQAQAKGESFGNAELEPMREPAERALFHALQSAREDARQLLERGDYTGYLRAFSVLKTPVDQFFDSVMVMAEEAPLRRNRLALLRDLRDAMNRVADISRLAQ